MSINFSAAPGCVFLSGWYFSDSLWKDFLIADALSERPMPRISWGSKFWYSLLVAMTALTWYTV